MSQKKLILIIDDNAINIMVSVDILEMNGFKTITAHYGTMGIQQALFYKPDLILLDIDMPQMDGYEVCKRLKANVHTQEIPIIFVSVFNEERAKVKAFAVGGAAYITQPFLIEELLACVKSHVILKPLRQV